MEQLPLLEGGVGLAVVTALILIVRYFLQHLGKKDKLFIGAIEKKDEVFTTVVSNHITHSIQSQEKMIATLDRLVDNLNK